MPTDLEPGEVVDSDFEILALAGRGSFSSVYRVVQRSRRRRVLALKVLHLGIQNTLRKRSGYAKNPYLKEQFLCARLRTSDVCRIIKVGSTADDRYYVALEWAAGATLDRHLIQYPDGLPLSQVADVLVPLGRTLGAMHKARVVHRDLKPANIMVEERKDHRLEIKVLDFGIAKLLDEDENLQGEEALLVGTPAYMSPEQAAGRRTDTRSDIFSLAAMTYEMLTGRRHVVLDAQMPTSDDYMDYLVSNRPLPTRPPSGIRPTLPPELDEIICRSLHRDCAQRPEDVDVFLSVLIPVLHAHERRPEKAGLFKRTVGRLLRR